MRTLLIALVLVVLGFTHGTLQAETKDPNLYVGLMTAQVETISTLDVRYAYISAPAEIEPSYFNQFSYEDIMKFKDAPLDKNNPLYLCKSVIFYHHIKKGDREFIRKEDYVTISNNKFDKIDSQTWNNPQNSLYASLNNGDSLTINMEPSTRSSYTTYENLIMYFITVENGGKVTKWRYSDCLRGNIFRWTDEADGITIEARFKLDDAGPGGWGKAKPATESDTGQFYYKVKLSSDYGYLPVYFQRSFINESNSSDTFIQYKEIKDKIYFPIRMSKKSFDADEKLFNFTIAWITDEKTLKINEDIPDSVFDFMSKIPVGCWVNDSITGRTYVHGKPEEGFK